MVIDGVWEDTPEMKFERVDGTQDWFQITVPAMDETQTNFKIRANGNWIYESKEAMNSIMTLQNMWKMVLTVVK